MTYPTACATAQCLSRSLSTGKERDAESGNDYFGARYYASSIGRFDSPDWSAKVVPVPYAAVGDPQSLNLYAYVRNSPIVRFDSDGHTCKQGDWGCNAWDAAGQAFDKVHAITSAAVSSGAAQAHKTLSSASRAVHSLANSPRAKLAVDGMKNGLVGYAKGAQAVGELAAAPATDGASVAFSAYTLVGAVGNSVASTTELIASEVGGSDEEMNSDLEGAEHLNTVTSVGGLVGLAVSGDWKKGEAGATIEAFGTDFLGNGAGAVRVNLLGRVGDAIDKLDTAVRTTNLIDPPK